MGYPETFMQLSSDECEEVNGGGFINDMFLGVIGGGSTGAVIGSAVAPGVGSVGGAVIGGLYGFVAVSIATAVDISQSKK